MAAKKKAKWPWLLAGIGAAVTVGVYLLIRKSQPDEVLPLAEEPPHRSSVRRSR